MDGNTARVRPSVPTILVCMMLSISARGVSANGTGISWEAPTLFTKGQNSSVQSANLTWINVPRVPTSRVLQSVSTWAKPVSLASDFDISIATTLVSTLNFEAGLHQYICLKRSGTDLPISSATSWVAPSLLPMRMTLKPFEASCRENSAPIPAVAPVTIAHDFLFRSWNALIYCQLQSRQGTYVGTRNDCHFQDESD